MNVLFLLGGWLLIIMSAFSAFMMIGFAAPALGYLSRLRFAEPVAILGPSIMIMLCGILMTVGYFNEWEWVYRFILVAFGINVLVVILVVVSFALR